MAIKSFACADTEALSKGRSVRRFREFEGVARRKLAMLAAAGAVLDLRTPPGNKLELLKGDRAGQHSIRINDRWRVCFVWPLDADGPSDVQIVDYH